MFLVSYNNILIVCAAWDCPEGGSIVYCTLGRAVTLGAMGGVPASQRRNISAPSACGLFRTTASTTVAVELLLRSVMLMPST